MYPQKQGRPQQGGINFTQPSFCPEQEQGFIEPSDTNEVWRSGDFSSVLSEHSSMVIVTRYFLVLKRVARKGGWQLLELWRCHCTNHFLFVNPPAASSIDVNDIQGATVGKTLVYHSASTTVFTLKKGSNISRADPPEWIRIFAPIFLQGWGDAIGFKPRRTTSLGEYFEC